MYFRTTLAYCFCKLRKNLKVAKDEKLPTDLYEI